MMTWVRTFRWNISPSSLLTYVSPCLQSGYLNMKSTTKNVQQDTFLQILN